MLSHTRSLPSTIEYLLFGGLAGGRLVKRIFDVIKYINSKILPTKKNVCLSI